MNDESKDLQNNVSGALSEHEKAAIREGLRVYMREHPARAPRYIRFFDFFERSAYNPRLQFVSGALAILLAGGTGTAFAAQGALPGDALYGVKVNVEEPIAGAFATSPEARANWNAQLAALRLSEAEQLAVQNKLTPENAAVVASGLNQATENFDATVAQLATSSQNATTVAALASNMETTLAANTQALNEIAKAVPASAPVLQPIIAGAAERAASLSSARTAMYTAAAESNSEQVELAARAALGSAQNQVSQAESNANASSSASSTAALQVRLAREQLHSGQQNIDDGDYVAALDSFQAASVAAGVAQITASIGIQLGTSTNSQASASSSSSTLPSLTATSSTSTLDTEDSTSSTSTDATSSSIHIFKNKHATNHS